MRRIAPVEEMVGRSADGSSAFLQCHSTRGRAVRAPTLPKVGVGIPPEIKLILKANWNKAVEHPGGFAEHQLKAGCQ